MRVSVILISKRQKQMLDKLLEMLTRKVRFLLNFELNGGEIRQIFYENVKKVMTYVIWLLQCLVTFLLIKKKKTIYNLLLP